ncbi:MULTISPECIES: DUF1801 domain-containing protein [Bacillus]|uniref:YdhG-like domain-containing protein n=1 Tax=Bacillus infantis NRRL B-14911 TaxID=1367477 RepID=U5L6A8_9BACI|nr:MULTISPECIES: DUF1801 domain-containing protein [Bacillus]AGX02898.1 hypothetical protein N288_04705 [Bacillus infantis NRRL B-14911]PLR71150.1 DUF1801 domain-containing protein [Bacillus sp. UMB0728]
MRNNPKSKLSGDQQVFEFMKQLEHPLKEEIEEVRRIILSSDERFTEHIKWNAPSFCIENDDRITFNLKGNAFFRLVFHCGAKVKPKAAQPLFEDHTGLLEWQTNDRAVVKFFNENDVKDKEEKLRVVIGKWIGTTSSKVISDTED